MELVIEVDVGSMKINGLKGTGKAGFVDCKVIVCMFQTV